MKKSLCILLLLVLALSVFANVTEKNRQEIVPVSSPIYRAMENLYVSQGLVLPSTTGPWSMAELDIMLDRINPELLSDDENAIYIYLVSKLKESARLNPDPNLGIGIGLDINAYMYAHTNAKDYSSLDDFGGNKDFKYAKPVLSIPLETWIASNIYGFSSFDIGPARTPDNGLSNFFTNIPVIPPLQILDIDLSFPHRAIGVIGGDNWYISVGRDQLRWGPGRSGNLTIGEQLPYHDNARISAFSDKFKYTFSLSSFMHPMNYKDWDEKSDKFGYIKDDSLNQDNRRDGLRMFIAHRLEWRIANKVNMALTESIMYQSETNHIDLLVLSPTAIFHNYYLRGNANSLLSFEIDYSPIKSLNIYSELLFDEVSFPWETSTSNAPPTSIGVIAGARTAFALSGGMLTASIEGAYTDPYLYLRGGYGDEIKNSVDFIINFPEILMGGSFLNDFNFLGYRYGNDNIVGHLDVGYEVFGKWNVGFGMTYIADGVMDMFSKWDWVDKGTAEDPMAPSSKPNGNDNYNWLGEDISKRNAVMHNLILDINGEICLFDSLSVFTELTFLQSWNYKNIKGSTSSDFQFTLGLSYTV